MQNFNLKRSTAAFKAAGLALLLTAVLAAVFIFNSSAALAQAPIVPCGTGTGPDCNICHLYEGTRQLINFFLFYIALPLTVVAVSASGIMFLISGSSEKLRTQAKSALNYAVIGMLLAFGAWVIVNTILDTLGFRIPFSPGRWTDYSICRQFDELARVPSGLPPPPPPPPPPGGLPPGALNHQEATSRLQSAGIQVVSTGNCSDRNNSSCTSLEGIRESTINRVISLKGECNCAVTVGGGTEIGHSDLGSCTHANGCKTDLVRNAQLDGYIEAHYQFIGTRSSDNARLYRALDGTEFARESTHWDMSRI